MDPTLEWTTADEIRYINELFERPNFREKIDRYKQIAKNRAYWGNINRFEVLSYINKRLNEHSLSR